MSKPQRSFDLSLNTAEKWFLLKHTHHISCWVHTQEHCEHFGPKWPIQIHRCIFPKSSTPKLQRLSTNTYFNSPTPIKITLLQKKSPRARSVWFFSSTVRAKWREGEEGRLWSLEISFGSAEEEGCGDERYHLVTERKKTAMTLHLVRSSRRLLISEWTL